MPDAIPPLNKSISRIATEKERQLRLSQRDRWFRSISTDHHFARLFDELSGVHFFAKDHQGRIMFLSRGALERFGMREEADAIGLTDFDLNLQFLSAGNALDDARIIATGEPIRGRLELWFNRKGLPDWYWVTKLPIRSRSGRIVGIAGILKHYNRGSQPGENLDAIGRVVLYVREHYASPITVGSLAGMVELSPRHLERKFQAQFGITPKQFLIRARVGAACRALVQTQGSLADIAADCGFYDQSALTQHFHACMEMTPSHYRRLHVKQSF